MKIKSKIFVSLFGMSLLIALIGTLAVDRQRASVTTSATKEAENVANLLGFVLFSNSNQLQTAAQETVSRIHQVQQRDIVLVNSQQLILADANPADVGKIFIEDRQDEVGSTIKDGKVRTFVEHSQDSPTGINQIVARVKSRSGHTFGAVILEYTPLYDELMQSTRTTTRQVITVCAISVALALLIAFYMGRSIAVPLQQLTRVATGFASGKTDVPMPLAQKDEIGELAKAFDNMIQKRREAEAELQLAHDDMEVRVKDRTKELENTHKELLETSRKAGMAEVATGILHNVGNVLNSVNIASSCVIDSLKKSKAANLSKVVALLHEHQSDLGDFLTLDPKGKQIPPYLAKLADHIAIEQADALRELAELQKNIGHIKDIVAMQQEFAKVSGTTETLAVSDLVEDALKMNAGAFARHDILLTRDFQKTPLVTVEKHKVLQILINLVNNAKQACDEQRPVEKRLTLRVTDANPFVRIAVSDNGIGVSPENLTRIFAHGFTTKKDGHGFGLHSGALAAMEIGGSLNVHSDGPGKGATFTLELPYCPTYN